jgi:hypothetical protein
MSESGLPYADFDRYCDEHDIKPGEEPAAFAAWLNEISNGQWDGDVQRVGEKVPDGQP